MPPSSRSSRSSVLFAVAAVLAVSASAPLAYAQAEDLPSDVGAGDTVVGELVQAYDDPGPDEADHEHGAGEHGEEHTDGLLSWVQTAEGVSVRVATEDVADIDSGSTVEVTVGKLVTDAAAAAGLQQAREVLTAEVVAAPPAGEPVPASAATPIEHQVTVVMMRPPGAPADSTTLAEVQAVVGGAVADFWSQQSGGRLRFSVAGGVDWASTSTACTNPLGLWNEAARRAGWTSSQPANGQHLLVFVPAGTPGCSYGLGTVGTGLASGGLSYVQAASSSVIAHEFGHNLSLGHSSSLKCDAAVEVGTCQVAAYEDYYDVMGVSWEQLGTLNLPQAARLGVLQAGVSGGYVELSDAAAGTSVTLAPVGGAIGTRGLRLLDGDGTVYWLENRQPVGQDSWLGSRANWPGLQTGVTLRQSRTGGDTSLLLDSTPSARSSWSSDNRVAFPVGTAVPVGDGDFWVTVQSVDAAGAVLAVTTAADARARRAAEPVAAVRSRTTLLPGELLSSPNGRFHATFQSDGNFVLYGDGRPVWSSSTAASGGRVIVQSDGNLVVYTGVGVPAWSTRTSSTVGVQLVVQDDGNLVLYRGGTPLWSSLTDRRDRLTGGQSLAGGQALTSPNGVHRAVMQSDGNLVVYGAAGRVGWTSGTSAPGGRLVSQPDGNVVLYTPGGAPVWSTRTSSSGSTSLVLQDDGNLVLYGTGGALWSSSASRTDLLRSGQTLQSTQALVSLNGVHRALLQADGNLVVYRNDGLVQYASRTSGRGTRLVLQTDGNAVLYPAQGAALWSTGTGPDAASFLWMQDDGNLVLYRGNGSVAWVAR